MLERSVVERMMGRVGIRLPRRGATMRLGKTAASLGVSMTFVRSTIVTVIVVGLMRLVRTTRRGWQRDSRRHGRL